MQWFVFDIFLCFILSFFHFSFSTLPTTFSSLYLYFFPLFTYHLLFLFLYLSFPFFPISFLIYLFQFFLTYLCTSSFILSIFTPSFFLTFINFSFLTDLLLFDNLYYFSDLCILLFHILSGHKDKQWSPSQAPSHDRANVYQGDCQKVKNLQAIFQITKISGFSLTSYSR